MSRDIKSSSEFPSILIALINRFTRKYSGQKADILVNEVKEMRSNGQTSRLAMINFIKENKSVEGMGDVEKEFADQI